MLNPSFAATHTCIFVLLYRREEGEPNPFEDPVLKDIASKTGKSVAQVGFCRTCFSRKT